MTVGKPKQKGYKPPPGRVVIERHGRYAIMSLCGIISIEDFEENKINLLTQKGRFSVLGSKLSLLSFEDRNVEIQGKIEEIKLVYAKN